MSWLSDRPRPVPSPAGLVVKNGLNIFAFTSSGMPVPLSRIDDFHGVAEVAGRRRDRRFVGAGLRRLALLRRVESVADEIEQHARQLLRMALDLAGLRVEALFDRDVEAGLFGARAVIGEVQRLLDELIDVDRRRSPEPSRECSSMFLTMESARLP